MSRLSEAVGTRAIDILLKMYADENFVPRQQNARVEVGMKSLGSEEPTVRSFDGDLIVQLGEDDAHFLKPFAQLDGFEMDEISLKGNSISSASITVRFELSEKGKDIIRAHIFETRYNMAVTLRDEVSAEPDA